jgi:hypothetical protein
MTRLSNCFESVWESSIDLNQSAGVGISLTGDYIWADEAASARGAVRPLRVKPSLLAA